MTTGQNEATDAERYAAALKAVIELTSEAVQAGHVVTPEDVLDAIGHEIQIELCFPQRVLLGVSSPLGPEPGPEFYAGRKVLPDEVLRKMQDSVNAMLARQAQAEKLYGTAFTASERDRICRSDD